MLNSKKRGFLENVAYEKWNYPVDPAVVVRDLRLDKVLVRVAVVDKGRVGEGVPVNLVRDVYAVDEGHLADSVADWIIYSRHVIRRTFRPPPRFLSCFVLYTR